MNKLKVSQDTMWKEQEELKKVIDDSNIVKSAWENLPPGWTKESLKSFWDSLTGDKKHKITQCMKKMEGKVSDSGAFCGSLADEVGYR